MVHPILGNRFGKIAFTAWWVAVAAIHTAVLYFFYGISFPVAISDSLIWCILFSVLSLGIWFWVRLSDIETQRSFSVALNHIGATAVSILILVSAHRYVLSLLFAGEEDYNNFLHNSLPGRVIIGVFFYILISLVYYLIIYISNFREKLSREAELKALVKDAELSWLKLQVNPHFLFNSLNSVSSLTMTAPEKAQAMITRLSELLRYSLRQSPDSMVTLNDELENCKKYLEIEKVRFGNRLKYTIDCCDECLKVPVPSMILQPLFENSIKHSVAQSADESEIRADISLKDSFLFVKVSNTLPNFPSSSSGTGVGLENIRRRLLLVYGSPNFISVQKSTDSFTVTVTIPTK
ncbi:MAG: histidine kinase [Tenuifilaceae bacterium]|jgi:glucose-6-phosphate-specific signal transduction histidine kinase|nr:histidine kinase [Tenuifilaceae bacterium]